MSARERMFRGEAAAEIAPFRCTKCNEAVSHINRSDCACIRAARRVQTTLVAKDSFCSLCGGTGSVYTVEGLDGCIDACAEHRVQVATDALADQEKKP